MIAGFARYTPPHMEMPVEAVSRLYKTDQRRGRRRGITGFKPEHVRKLLIKFSRGDRSRLLGHASFLQVSPSPRRGKPRWRNKTSACNRVTFPGRRDAPSAHI